MTTKQIRVTGTVQGVGYRYFAQKNANRYQLTGYAMNMPDGSVKLIAQGHDPQLEAFIGCLESGPRFASVESISVDGLDETETYYNFEVY